MRNEFLDMIDLLVEKEVTPERIREVESTLQPRKSGEKALGHLRPELRSVWVLLCTFPSINFTKPEHMSESKLRDRVKSLRKAIKGFFWDSVNFPHEFQYTNLGICKDWVVVNRPTTPPTTQKKK